MTKTIKVLHYPVNDEPRIIETQDDLVSLQKLVGGYLEVVQLDEGLDVYCNEEALLNGMLPNRVVGFLGKAGFVGTNVIHGPFFVAKSYYDGDISGLSEYDVEMAKKVIQ